MRFIDIKKLLEECVEYSVITPLSKLLENNKENKNLENIHSAIINSGENIDDFILIIREKDGHESRCIERLDNVAQELMNDEQGIKILTDELNRRKEKEEYER